MQVIELGMVLVMVEVAVDGRSCRGKGLAYHPSAAVLDRAMTLVGCWRGAAVWCGVVCGGYIGNFH